MDDLYFKRIITTVILVVLLILAFYLLQPLLLAIILGLILAFVFAPLYNRLFKLIKSKNLSAMILCILILLAVIIPLVLLLPLLIDQSITLYMATQQMDFITPLKEFFPSIFISEQFSGEIASIISSSINNLTNSIMNYFSNIILNLPLLLFQSIIVFFTFFFTIRDKEELITYIKTLLPFSPDVEKKLFESSKNITNSFIYGQIIIGSIQGLIIGIGFFIFQVPNALLLAVFATLAGILPVIGPSVVWIPTVIYLWMANNTTAVLGVGIFGIISSFSDNLLRPVIVSKRARLNPAIALIGMIGGYLLIGVLGFILGPLILSYLIIILELYRDKKLPDLLIEKSR